MLTLPDRIKEAIFENLPEREGEFCVWEWRSKISK